jgi:UDP-N-acetylglucosamine 1-carboxyvinyltransferase
MIKNAVKELQGMQKLIITGGKKLSGEVVLQGAKNAILPILAAAVLCDGEVVLTNCPKLSDTYAAMRILNHLGYRTTIDGNIITVKPSDFGSNEIPDELMREMRSSIIFMGPIVGKTGKCKMTFPGGCDIGPRPIDMHVSALRKMGVSIHEEHGQIDCIVEKRLIGAKIVLSFPSVGATENIMLAAVLAEGKTVIKNAAREPEIVDLARFLKACGAKIYGEGEGSITIIGVEKLHGCEYRIMPDRIAGATYLACAAASGGECLLKDCHPWDLDSIIPVFEQMGCYVNCYGTNIYICGKNSLKAVDTIRTMVYPGFPTDIQAIIMAVLCKAKGTTIFVENIFENRYKHVGALQRMGADIKVEGKVAVVEGVPILYGAKIEASDLRGGAGLVTAALSAEGTTEISGVHYIDRGYENIETVLSSLGADIARI